MTQSKAKSESSVMNINDALFEYILRLADDRLILGHRLSEWCGHGPILEEDIAITNMALDYIGQATSLLEYAGEIENKGRSEDDIAFFRDTIDYRCLKITELPRGDFGFTIARQLLFSVFSYLLFNRLQKSEDKTLAGISAKAFKECRYHVRHSRKWTVTLGDGTEESHTRIQNAFNELWRYTNELFYMDDVDELLLDNGIAADLNVIKPEWKQRITEVLDEGNISVPPDDQYMVDGSREGLHTEHLGHLLAEMQRLPRSYPDATW